MSACDDAWVGQRRGEGIEPSRPGGCPVLPMFKDWMARNSYSYWVSGFGGMEKGMTGSSVASDCVLMLGNVGGEFLPGVLDVLGQHPGWTALVCAASDWA